MENEIYGVIYKGIDPLGKIYIGKTTSDPWQLRICQHKAKGKKDWAWSKIDIAYSAGELENKECYWIQKYDSANPEKGHNKRIGSGALSTHALIANKINKNSNLSTSHFYSKDKNFYFSFDNAKTYDLYERWDSISLNKIQCCLLNTFLFFIATDKYKLNNRTICISKQDIIRHAPYLSTIDFLSDWDDLLRNKVLILNRKLSLFDKRTTYDIYDFNNRIAFKFHKGCIKKFTVSKEVDFDNE